MFNALVFADQPGAGDGPVVGALAADLGLAAVQFLPQVKVDVKLQDSDDDTTYTAVTDANDVLVAADGVAAAPDVNGIVATIDAAAEDETRIRLGYVGNKRYARLIFDFTGTHSTGLPLALLGILGHPHLRPVTD